LGLFGVHDGKRFAGLSAAGERFMGLNKTVYPPSCGGLPPALKLWRDDMGVACCARHRAQARSYISEGAKLEVVAVKR
jgi:hypothetical protein